MKRLLLLNVLVMMVLAVSGQTVDVVYLKNGSVIRGSVTEMDQDQVKVSSPEGGVYTFPKSEVERMEMETAQSLAYRSDDRLLEKKGGDLRWEGTSVPIADIELSSVLGDDLYDTYQSAHRQVSRGNTFLVCGGVCVGAAIAGMFSYGNQLSIDGKETGTSETIANLSMLLAYTADVFMALGCVYRGIGNGRLRWVRDTYNGRGEPSASMSFHPSVMLSSDNDLALGASVSIRF